MRTLTVTRRRAGTGWVWRAAVGFREVAVEKTIPTVGEDSLVGCDRGVKVTRAPGGRHDAHDATLDGRRP